MVMGCASTKSSHVTTTAASVVEVSQGLKQTENAVNGLEPPPLIIEGERPPSLIENTAAATVKDSRPTDIGSNFRTAGNGHSLRDDMPNSLKEVQLVAPAPDINGSTVSVTLTPDEVDESALKELLEERTPVKVVVKQSTDWMKQMTSTAEEEFQRLTKNASENASDILHMASYEPNSPSSSSSSSSEDELEISMDQKLDVENSKLEKAG